MIRRNRRGRFAKQREASRWERIICLSILGGILLGITIDVIRTNQTHYVYAKEDVIEPEPKEVPIRVHIEWTSERIEKEIRDTFPEEPNTAVAIVKSEGGLVTEKQSQIFKDGVQEPSFCAFQIHAPSWDHVAKRLGYGDYRTNVESCVKMARYIYEKAGHKWTDWSAYKNGSYKNNL